VTTSDVPVDLGKTCRFAGIQSTIETSAVDFARRLVPNITTGELSQLQLKAIAARIYLIQHDLEQVDRRAAA
jgi:hypothetical protein